MIIGYKAFNPDMTCLGFKYEVGKTYETHQEISLCKRGFHFCVDLKDCFLYYPQPDAVFAKVAALGTVIQSDRDSKCVTNKIRILEMIPRIEAVASSNTGHCNSGIFNTGTYNSGRGNSGHNNSGSRNTGCCNSGHNNTGHDNAGDSNTGHYNAGDHNTGDYNTGSYNTGDWNKGWYNTGCFMTDDSLTIPMFNKPSDWSYGDWIYSSASRIMSKCPVDVIDHSFVDGCLQVHHSGGDRQRWWDELPAIDKAEVMALPNFDPDIFYQCTGIKVSDHELV
jgi:hypothetical protein